MKKLWMIGTVMLIISLIPIMLMMRERLIAQEISTRYVWSAQETSWATDRIIADQKIALQQTTIGEPVALSAFDELRDVKNGEVVSMQLVVNDEPIGEPVEAVLPQSRMDHTHFYNWIAAYLVRDQQTNEQMAVVVQRSSTDDAPMNAREWRVTQVHANGDVQSQVVPYAERSQYPFETYMINQTGTVLMSMGFYTDMLHYYPSLFFPIIFPFLSLVIGLALIMMSVIYSWRQKRAVGAC